MEKRGVIVMLVFGLVRLVDGTIDVSGFDDCRRDEAAAGEDVLTLLPDFPLLLLLLLLFLQDVMMMSDVVVISVVSSKGCLP